MNEPTYILFLGNHESPSAAQLRELFGLDEQQLSRLLDGFPVMVFSGVEVSIERQLKTGAQDAAGIIFRCDSEDIEMVGECWNAFVELFFSLPGRVWISTYERALRELGAEVEAHEGKRGYVLEATQFEEFLSSN